MARAVRKKELTAEERLAAALVPEEEQPYKVPGNWCWTMVGCVADVVTGGTPSKKHEEYYGGQFPFFKPSDLDAGRNVHEASEYLSDEGKKVARIIPAKSSAVCCIGTIGKCGYLLREGTTNQQINSAIPKFNPLYLFYYFQTEQFVNELWSKAAATTISIVNKSKMESCCFPLAPKAEQQRIVTLIESLFADLDEAKEKLTAVVEGFAQRKAAILHQAFTGELTAKWREENGGSKVNWKIYKYGELGSSKLGKMLDRNKNIGKPVRYLRNINIRWFEVDVSDLMEMLATEKEIEELSVKEGDLFICEGGEPGRCAIWHGKEESIIFQKALHRFRANEKVIAEYLCYYLYYMSLSDTLENYFTGTTIKHLTGKSLCEIPISTSPVDEQREIVRIIDDLFEQEQQAQSTVETVLADIDTLKKSILARAFRGELSTNDPQEENAVEMLKKML